MKQPERPKANASSAKAPKTSLPLMTPRNLVPATPMRFTGDSSDNSIISGVKPVGKVVKGPQRSGKDKSSVPLPPGYVDRAAQRRSGAVEPEKFALDIFERADSKKAETTTNETSESAKLKFLEESAGTLEFPSCKNVEIEHLMNFILTTSPAETKIVSDAFRPNEAFLQFKSIEEAKTQPFDPFHRPRKVFRASSNRAGTLGNAENADEEVVERVREAMARLKSATERNQKYLDTLAAASTTVSMSDDIFPDAGRFDERSVIDSVIKQQESMHIEAPSAKTKAKNRLFGSKKQPEKDVNVNAETEVDVFELIAQKPLDEKKAEDLDSASAGGLFGFSNILPKLSRLEDENDEKKGTKLSGVYASILSDNEAEGETKAERLKHNEEDDDDKESGYMYSDSDDEEDADVSKPLGNNKRKLARKEDKEAAKVEKLVKSKFGVDLSK